MKNALALTAVLTLSLPAFAHITLVSPAVRTTSNKSCPCGNAGGTQTCSSQAAPAARANVTTLAAGATITVQINETVGHSGRFRVAFNPNGESLAGFNAHILADVADPSDGTGTRNVQVTLPNTPCNTCTLQVLQVMNGNTVDPVPDPTGFSTYFQCADLILTGAGGEGEGEGEGEGAAGEGEGEGAAGEGEGEGAAGEGEGEGAAGEGEGEGAAGGEGEGEGAAGGEGEGEGAAGGEGEGEGTPAPSCACGAAGAADTAVIGAAIGLLAVLRRRRR